MKKILLFASLFLLENFQAQTTIFQDNFENGSAGWQLNGGSGNNIWVLNSEYLGFSGFIDDTPSQPGSFTGGTNSNYLHINNTQICSAISACNANFDTGSASNQNATMAANASTTGMTNVTFSFWYVCAGAPNVSYGSVEYSTNGTNWTAIGATLSGVTTWTQLDLTDPAFNNQATLKFRFKWINGSTGNDPAFSVDEVRLIGTPGASSSIATNAVTPASACFNATTQITVPFNATGTFTAGNVFTAQLSNASGSFAVPVVIGTLTSASSGSQTINATIGASTPIGSGYRIRVISSTPATVGTDNGIDFVVNALPTASITPPNASIITGQSVSLTASGGLTYSWAPPTGLNVTTGETVIASPTVNTTYTVTATNAAGCTATGSVNVVVTSNVSISELKANQKLVLFPNPAANSFQVAHDFETPMQMLLIRDINGRIVRTFNKPTTEKFQITDIQSGLYTVEITFENSVYAVRLMIP